MTGGVISACGATLIEYIPLLVVLYGFGPKCKGLSVSISAAGPSLFFDVIRPRSCILGVELGPHMLSLSLQRHWLCVF
jgi:hypothetical protein